MLVSRTDLFPHGHVARAMVKPNAVLERSGRGERDKQEMGSPGYVVCVNLYVNLCKYLDIWTGLIGGRDGRNSSVSGTTSATVLLSASLGFLRGLWRVSVWRPPFLVKYLFHVELISLGEREDPLVNLVSLLFHPSYAAVFPER